MSKPAYHTISTETLVVYEKLRALSNCGELTQTTSEIACALGISRQSLHKHMVRLRKFHMLEDISKIAYQGNKWRKLRRVVGDNPLETLDNLVVNGGGLQRALLSNLNSKFKKPNPKETDETDVNPSVYNTAKRSAGALRGCCASTEATMLPIDELLENALAFGKKPRRVLLAHLPPYPGVPRFASVHVPPMPRLPKNIPIAAGILIKSYKAACSHRYGRKPRVDKSTKFRMLVAARIMHTLGVLSPYAWAGFRLSQWSYSPHSAKPPGIDYVFSGPVIEQHRKFYADKVASYDVIQRVFLAPSHAELLTRWENCRRAALCPSNGEDGEAVTRKIVARELPPRVYKQLAAKIASERSALEADLRRRMLAGEWIW